MFEERALRRSSRRSELGRAAIDVAATVGFEAMTMEHIASTAGVVRRTVRRYFPDTETAFSYGYQEAIEELRVLVQDAYDAGSTPFRRAYVCLDAIARYLAADPARAQALVVAGHSAGPGPLGVHQESMRRMACLIQHNARDLVPERGDGRVLAEMAAGGIYGVIFARTLRGEVRELPALVPEWTRAVIAPYVAIAERQAAADAGDPVETAEDLGSPCLAES